MARSSYAETRSRTAVIFWTTLLFGVGILLLSGTVGYLGSMVFQQKGEVLTLLDRGLWMLGALGGLLVIFAGKYLITGTDGHRIASSMGGTFIDAAEGIPEVYEERKFNRRIESFVHYVETCALSAGLTDIPAPYIIFEEMGMNAFAAGSGTGKTVVAITEGALLEFTDEELEGVVGHEVGHIVQGDTRFATRMVAFCVTLMIAAEIGWFLFRLRGGRDNRVAVFGLVVALGGLLGTLCARLMQAYVSRQAEYRADASGALYAGSPRGLISALKKIDRMSTADMGTRISPAYAHMMLAPPGAVMGLSARLISLSFATHPPTASRIEALDGDEAAETPAREPKNSPFHS